MSGQTVTRAEGYRLGRPKEEDGLRAVEHFFRSKLDIELTRIAGAEANYRRGDLLAQPWNQSIECKRQPIDPDKYARNFVEVAEITDNDRHLGGAADLANILNLLNQPSHRVIGHHERLSVSIRSLTVARLVAYVNPEPPLAHLYLYDSLALLEKIRAEVASGHLVRGAGHSNDDTLGVFVDIAPARWTADCSAATAPAWTYTGVGSESLALAGLQFRLAAPTT